MLTDGVAERSAGDGRVALVMEPGGNTQRMETAAPSVRSTGRLSSQEREDGQDPSVLALVIREIELGEHGRDVRFDGLDRQVHLMGDRCVGQPLRHEGEDGPFPIGESVERVALTSAGDELGIDDGLAECDLTQVRAEGTQVGDAILEEISDATIEVRSR